MPDRTYSEEEVAELLRRAAELQAHGPPAGADRRPGLTLDELAAIAADAGLDPEHLRLAAAEMQPGLRPHRLRSRATSTEISTERWIPVPLTDQAVEDVIAELRHRFDMTSSMGGSSMGMESYGKSTVQTVGRSVEWRHMHPWYGTQTRVLIQPRDEGTRVRVMQNNAYSGTATGWSVWWAPFLAVGAAFATGPIAGSFLIGILAALVTLAVTVPLLAQVGRGAMARQQLAVENLADEIAAELAPGRGAPIPAPAGPQRAGAPLLTPEPDHLRGEEHQARQRGRVR